MLKPGEPQHAFGFYHKERVSGVAFVRESVLTTGFDGNFLVRNLNSSKLEQCFAACACPLSGLLVLEPHLVLLASWYQPSRWFHAAGALNLLVLLLHRDGAIRYLDLRQQSVVHEFQTGQPVR